jgi:hypothetical protein
MKRVLALGVAAVALAITAAGLKANPNTLTLAVFGDSPYLDPAFAPHSEFAASPAFIATINADPSVQTVVHVGDIHSGSEPCTFAYDESIYDLWTAFQKPLVYTPGDNEWSDCTKAKEEPGSDNDNFTTHPDMPLEQLGFVRSIFFAHPLDADLLGTVQLAAQDAESAHALAARREAAARPGGLEIRLKLCRRETRCESLHWRSWQSRSDSPTAG